MDRSTVWTGIYAYIVVQVAFIMSRLVKLVEWSWWIVFSPVLLILIGGLLFLIYFGLTCNPRIEDKNG